MTRSFLTEVGRIYNRFEVIFLGRMNKCTSLLQVLCQPSPLRSDRVESSFFVSFLWREIAKVALWNLMELETTRPFISKMRTDMTQTTTTITRTCPSSNSIGGAQGGGVAKAESITPTEIAAKRTQVISPKVRRLSANFRRTCACAGDQNVRRKFGELGESSANSAKVRRTFAK